MQCREARKSVIFFEKGVVRESNHRLVIFVTEAALGCHCTLEMPAPNTSPPASCIHREIAESGRGLRVMAEMRRASCTASVSSR